MQSDINGKQTQPVRINVIPEFVYRLDLCFVASNGRVFGIQNTKQDVVLIKFTLIIVRIKPIEIYLLIDVF